ILRVEYNVPDVEIAAIVEISADGTKATFDAGKDWIDFPGGAKKFTIRWDPQSKRYWALSNFVPEKHRSDRPARVRNTLALVSSPDVKTWEVRATILYVPEMVKHGFQYADWLFDGDDLIALVRTAHDDGVGGARSFHDANCLTFHRIPDFRKLTTK